MYAFLAMGLVRDEWLASLCPLVKCPHYSLDRKFDGPSLDDVEEMKFLTLRVLGLMVNGYTDCAIASLNKELWKRIYRHLTALGLESYTLFKRLYFVFKRDNSFRFFFILTGWNILEVTWNSQWKPRRLYRTAFREMWATHRVKAW
jgi:hypothetical protein